MRYIYALRNKAERKNVDLRLWKQEIETSIKEYVGNSNKQLRDVWVKKDCFEFSVANCLQNTDLQSLGKLLLLLNCIQMKIIGVVFERTRMCYHANG